ncbi:hypothetical protein CU669_10900 [Paramagnetospirillum kuznetsovii]|uniref:O-antigen ligase-related domain-containing protein n=1 Tax=Paramagnetospirillum kuznetsovii TaxID=2053833 RepID=A0A364NY19_9PROT|nr:O-antigen ligase family protein [Paramagnetospirillum kuznetsovii]RAU21807.1 hypothetical protein CU669_10900 [Paramagnetospirillum kuznetsovii]
MSEERTFLERAPEYTFALAALVAPPLAVLVPLGMAVYLPIFGGLCAILFWRGGDFGLLPIAPLILVAALCGWGAISLLWAMEIQSGALAIVRLAALSIAGSLSFALAGTIRLERFRFIVPAFTLGIFVAAVVLIIEVETGNGLSQLIFHIKAGPGQFLSSTQKSLLGRGGTVLALLIWPFIVLAWRARSHWAIGGIGIAMVALLLSDSLAGRLALAFGGAMFLLVRISPRIWLRVLKAAVVVCVLILPGVISRAPQPPETFDSMPWLPLSAHHRLLIWHFAADRIAEHRMLGWGMDASRSIPGGDETVNLIDYYPVTHGTRRVINGNLMPLHPHNAILQCWLELGLGGALILAAFLWTMVGNVEKSAARDPLSAAGIAGCIVAALVVSAVSYGAWQSWWVSTLWVVATFCRLTISEPLPSSGEPSI